MSYNEKTKTELIEELLLLKAENERLSSVTKAAFDKTEIIHQSELRYELFFENNHSTMLLIDPETGEIKDANPAASKYYGWSREELCQKDISEINMLSKDEVKTEMLKARDEKREHFFFRHRLASNEIRNVEVYSGPIKFDDSTYLYSIVHDISDRIQAEENLRISEEKYRNIFESIQDTYYEATPEGVLLDISPSIEIISNGQFTRNELIGNSFVGMYADQDARTKFKEQLFKNRYLTDYELSFLNKDSSVVPVSVSSILILDEAGTPYKITGSMRDITERKKSEKILQESEERFRQVVEQTSELIAITDINGFITYASSLSSMFQLSPEEMVGRNFIHFVAESDLAQSVNGFRRMLEDGSVIKDSVSKMKRADGSEFYGELNSCKFQTATHKGALLTIRDISDRKKDEEALSEKTAILTNLIVNSKEGIMLENAARQIVLTNQLFCDMFGIPAPPEVMIGADCTQSAEQSKILFKNPDKFVECIDQILADRKPVFNDELELADGRYFERDYIPTYLKNSYSGHLWKYRDVTEKKNAEIVLKKISQAVEQSPVMTVITGLDGNIEYVNPAILKMTGFSKDDLIGQNPRILSSGEKSKEDYQKLWKTISAGNEWQGEFHNKKKNGESYWAGALISPIFDSNGKNTHYLSVEEDITQRKKIEYELLELNSKLEFKVEERTLQLNEAKQKLENDISERILIESDLRWNKSLLELMSNSSPLGFLVVDNRTDDILYFNHRFCSIWDIEQLEERMDHGEFKNNDIIPYCLPVLADIPAFAESCKPLQFEENRIVIEDEIAFTNNRTVRRFSTQIRGKNDEYYGRFYIFEDITDRKQSEIELLKSKYKYKSVVENINEVVFQIDTQGLWLYLNPAWESITGFCIEESIGTLFLNYVHSDDRQLNMELFEPLILRKKEYYRHEIRYLTKDGGFKWIEVFARLGLDENDQITGTYGTLQDITERKLAKEFENVMLELTTQFAGITYSEIDSAINLALSRIGNFLNADRAYIFELDTMFLMSNTYEWHNVGIIPEKENLQNIPVEVFPMWMETLRRHENIVIESVPDLPETWQAERDILELQHIKSLIVMPMFSENTLIGFVGLDAVHEKKIYNEAEINILKIWSSMLASLINNLHSDELLEQTRQNFETFFNTIDDFLWVLDDTGNIIYTNNTVLERLGYAASELESKSVLMAHPAERREEAGRIVGEMLAGAAVFCPVPLVTKSGVHIPVETRVKSGYWDSKPVIFGVSKDMSKIQLSEEKFSKAFHSNSASMAISGYEDGVFIDVNDTFISTMGHSRDELIGCASSELNLFEDTDIRNRIFIELKKGVKIRDVEIKVIKKSGEKISGLFSAEQIYVGNKLCLLTLFVDITERKKAEEESRSARLEAEKANMAKSEFLSRMSHELRTPMNSILGFAQLLDMGELNASQKRGVNHIMQSGKHLLELINQVLDISRIEAGRLSISIEPVQLKGVFEEILDILNPLATKSQIRFKLVDSPATQFFVSADRQSFKQVLLNLINNAIKYNKEAGLVTIETESRMNIDGSFIRISISDTGVGIDLEDIPKLFIPFERIGHEKNGIEGTGLGLAVVKKLVDAMGGKYGVESVPEEGSTFWIELPQAESQRNMLDKSLVLNEIAPDLIQYSGIVLYVEDNLSNIELIQEILTTKRPGIELKTSVHGKETVKLALELRPDLILLDLNLPDINGGEVLKLVLENSKTKDIPVIIVSADGMQHQVEKLIKAGAKKFLTKPIEVSVLLNIIDEFIQN